jgi:hypothetical protein
LNWPNSKQGDLIYSLTYDISLDQFFANTQIPVPRLLGHTRYGIDVFHHDGSSCSTCEDQVSLAAGPAEFLDFDYAGGKFDDIGCFQFFYHCATAAYGWNSMVCFILLPSLQIRNDTNLLSRYFSYEITVSALCLFFIIVMLWLISQRQLLPGIVIIGSFILFVLWLVGLIVISIQLWGPQGSVNSNCQTFVTGQGVKGTNTATLAWLEQNSICKFVIGRSGWRNLLIV